MTRVLVTGHAGFIGKHTCGELLRKGYQLVGIDRNASNVATRTGRLAAMRIDVTDSEQVVAAFERHRPHKVVHLAANSSLQTSVTNAPYDAMQNVIGTLNVIGACQRYKVDRLVFASTSAVYGPSEGALTEDLNYGPTSPYGVSKAAGEMYCAASGLSYACLRYGNVYGPGQKPIGENILIARALAHMIDGAPFHINGDGENVRDWVYVRDVVSANLEALESDVDGNFNVATGQGASVNEIIKELIAITGFRNPIEYGPAKKGELRNVVMPINKIHNEIGWGPVTHLKTGLAMTVRAWKQPLTVWNEPKAQE